MLGYHGAVATHSLDTLLEPRSIAVIGASDRKGSPGRALARSVLDSDYEGRVHLVNPRKPRVLGRACLASLRAIEGDVDLALVTVPENILIPTLKACAAKGIPTAIVYSGIKATDAVDGLASSLGIRVIGPWSIGLRRPRIGLNATLASNQIGAGSLAVVSQSASLTTSLVDWAEAGGIGFSALVSTGAEENVHLSDILDVLAEDAATRAIVVYLDRVRSSRRLLSALAAAARRKPVVLMKSPQDDAPYCDALTRGGDVLSSDDTFQAALARVGVVRVRSYTALFAAAQVLATRVRLRGKRIAIIGNSAAVAMFAQERLQALRFEFPLLEQEQQQALGKTLLTLGGGNSLQRWLAGTDVRWNGRNPIELREHEHLAEQLNESLSFLASTRMFDAVLVIYAADPFNDDVDIARATAAANTSAMPVLACWIGDSHAQSARAVFNEEGIPNFAQPEAAIDAIQHLFQYYRGQQQLLQLPMNTAQDSRVDVHAARSLIDSALQSGERILGPQRNRQLLQHFDIDVLPASRATTVEEAIEAANHIGYPVVIKLVSPNIAWKAPVMRTVLNVSDEAGVAAAFDAARKALHHCRPDAEFRGVLVESQLHEDSARELYVSMHRDATFGPTISVGIGGDLSSLIQARTAQLPPLNSDLAKDMLSSPPLADYLNEFRHHAAIDTSAITAVLQRVSEMACELPAIFSLHINPLIVSNQRVVAVDIHTVLEPQLSLPNAHKRYGHLAIHPWPRQWTRSLALKDGRTVELRAIRPEDSDALQAMVAAMSEQSRYLRFMHSIKALSPAMLAQFTKLDYDRQIAFVADPGDGSVAGVSRYTIDRGHRAGEFAITVADSWQSQGLATHLMQLLIEHARSRELDTLYGDVLIENHGMRQLMGKLGFTSRASELDHELLVYSMPLEGPPT